MRHAASAASPTPSTSPRPGRVDYFGAAVAVQVRSAPELTQPPEPGFVIPPERSPKSVTLAVPAAEVGELKLPLTRMIPTLPDGVPPALISFPLIVPVTEAWPLVEEQPVVE